jgi:hypothetical protein
MSRYTELACLDCKVRPFLGKVILQESTDTVWYFSRGLAGSPPHSQQPELTRSSRKMLADHASHNLRVIVEGSPEDDLVTDEFIEIGGDRIIEVSVEEYLKDWPG